MIEAQEPAMGPTESLMRPGWVDPRIKQLRASSDNGNARVEAELLDAVFFSKQSALERSHAALRNRCDWKSHDRRCRGDLSYKALAIDGGIARSSFAASLPVLQRVGVVSVGDGWNYDARGHREPNAYFIGEGSFADQLRMLLQSGARVSVPVKITSALLGAYDDLDGNSEITPDQLMTATGLAERVINDFIRGACKAGKLYRLGVDRFRFADRCWGPKPKSDLTGKYVKSDSGKSYVKSDLERKIGLNKESTFSGKYIPESKSSKSESSRASSTVARTRARAAAIASRTRLDLDGLKALARSAIEQAGALATLSDEVVSKLLAEAVRGVMPEDRIERQADLALSMFRRWAPIVPQTGFGWCPEVLFVKLRVKADGAGRINSWTFFDFVEGDLQKHRQEALVACQVNAAQQSQPPPDHVGPAAADVAATMARPSPREIRNCRACNGTGRIKRGFDWPIVLVTCAACSGSGLDQNTSADASDITPTAEVAVKMVQARPDRAAAAREYHVQAKVLREAHPSFRTDVVAAVGSAVPVSNRLNEAAITQAVDGILVATIKSGREPDWAIAIIADGARRLVAEGRRFDLWGGEFGGVRRVVDDAINARPTMPPMEHHHEVRPF